MPLDIFHNQSPDIFKRFEIKLPEKKTERLLQIGNEIFYKNIFITADSRFIICFSTAKNNAVVHIREIPSGKCMLKHTFSGENIDIQPFITTDNIAIITIWPDKNLVVKFPEGEIIKAFSGFLQEVTLTHDKKGFVFELDKEYYLFFPPEDLIKLPQSEHRTKKTMISPFQKFAVMQRLNEIEVFDIENANSMYCLKEEYKIDNFSISSDSKFLIYNTKFSQSGFYDGDLKCVKLTSGESIGQLSAFLPDAEYTCFNNCWVINSGQVGLIYFPHINLFKDMQIGAFWAIAIKYNDINYLLTKQSIGKYQVIKIFNVDRFYDANGNPLILHQLDLEGSDSQVYVSQNQNYFAVSIAKDYVKLYSVEGFKEIVKIKTNSYVDCEFTADGKYLIVKDYMNIGIYSTLNGEKLNKGTEAIYSSSIDAKSGNIALEDTSRHITIRSINTGEILHKSKPSNHNFTLKGLSNNHLWLFIQNGVNFYLNSIDIINQNHKTFDLNTDLSYIQESGFLPGKTGVIELETEKYIPFLPQFQFSSYSNVTFYVSKKFTVLLSEHGLLVYENISGKLLKKNNLTRFSLNSGIIFCGDNIVYLYEKHLHIDSIYNHRPDIQSSEVLSGSCNLLQSLDNENFVMLLYDSGPSKSKVLHYNINNPDKYLNKCQLPDSASKMISVPGHNGFFIANSSQCWFMSLKDDNLNYCLEIPELEALYQYKEMLVCVSTNNQIGFYNILGNSTFKAGELIATLYTIADGFLWTIPGNEALPEGCFWTKNPEYIEVMQYSNQKHEYILLDPDSEEWQKYIDLHNRQDIVMSRLFDHERYFETLNDLLGKIQLNVLQQFKHNLMLNS